MSTRAWREKNRDRFNELWRRWYDKNAPRKIAWQHRRRLELRAWWRELKSTKRCEQCGEDNPSCLHFHHDDPATKDFDLSVAASNGWSRKRILAEVAKCRVLCANCHLKHHWQERENGRGDRI
jgi:hypothetical protein